MPRPVLLASIALLTGCTSAPEPRLSSSTAWDGTVQRWGSVRELHGGDASGRVEILSATTPATHGIGAMAGLEGEILIADGVARISRGADMRTLNTTVLVTSRDADPSDRAALLVTAEVHRWRAIPIDRALDEPGLEAFVKEQLEGTRHEKAKVVPLRIEGNFPWEGHVLAGGCPMAAVLESATPGAAARALPPPPPVRKSVTAASPTSTTIVGFLADLPAGQVTHRGSRFHLHALHGWFANGGEVAHVDAFTIGPGAMLWLPALMEPEEREMGPPVTPRTP